MKYNYLVRELRYMVERFDPPFWAMPDQYIKYWFLKLLGRKPLWYWDAVEWDEYCPGSGVYISDGVYFSLHTWATMEGFTPMWKNSNEFR